MDEELIDSINTYPKGIEHQSIKMFAISLGLMLIQLACIVIDNTSGVRIRSLDMVIAVAGVIATILSIGGLVVGITEVSYSKKWGTIGIIGNIFGILHPFLYILF